jgi:hypothetical protein
MGKKKWPKLQSPQNRCAPEYEPLPLQSLQQETDKADYHGWFWPKERTSRTQDRWKTRNRIPFPHRGLHNTHCRTTTSLRGTPTIERGRDSLVRSTIRYVPRPALILFAQRSGEAGWLGRHRTEPPVRIRSKVGLRKTATAWGTLQRSGQPIVP